MGGKIRTAAMSGNEPGMTDLVNNDPDSVRIRKNKGTLLLTGAGVAAFGIWSVIKVFMEFIFIPVDESLVKDIRALGYVGTVFVIVLVVLMIMTDVIIRIFVFFCARKESKGYKARGLIFTSILLVTGSIFSILIVIGNVMLNENAKLDITDYVSFFVELTSMVIIFEMIAASAENRKLLAKKRREAAHAA